MKSTLLRCRHHGLEAEVQPACETAVSLDIRNRLGLLGTHRFRQVERGRDLVGIDIFAEINSRFDKIIGERTFPGAVRAGNYQ